MKLAHSPLGLHLVLVAALCTWPPLSATGQGWKPDRPVEIIVPSASGSGGDSAARAIQRILQTQRYVDVPVTVHNKAGGNGAIARNYLNQHEGNGHYLYIAAKDVLRGRAMGLSNYEELTPVAILFGEYIGIGVNADSPIKSGRDLIERMKKDPGAYSVGHAAGGMGGTNHQALASALKSANIDIRKTRNVTFTSGAQAITALLGGHIDVVPVSAGSWVPHLKTGAVRVIAVSAPERLPDAFAGVPTWREQGVNTVVFNWRALFTSRGVPAPQVAYWEGIFQRLTATPEWKVEMTQRGSITQFNDAAAMKKRMAEEYLDVKALLIDLELAKK